MSDVNMDKKLKGKELIIFVQKLIVDFICGGLSSVITVCNCFRFSL